MRAQRTINLFLIVVVCILAGSPVTRNAARAEEGDDVEAHVKKLDQHVALLEKTVLEDPFKPKSTVLARLDTIEERLRKLDNADAKGDERSFEEMKKALKEQEKVREKLERRLLAVEQATKKDGAEVGAVNDVKELRRDVDQMQRAMDDLKTRINKVESKR